MKKVSIKELKRIVSEGNHQSSDEPILLSDDSGDFYLLNNCSRSEVAKWLEENREATTLQINDYEELNSLKELKYTVFFFLKKS